MTPTLNNSHLNNFQWKDHNSTFLLLSKMHQKASGKSDGILIAVITFKFMKKAVFAILTIINSK